jgi:hypothetical protein
LQTLRGNLCVFFYLDSLLEIFRVEEKQRQSKVCSTLRLSLANHHHSRLSSYVASVLVGVYVFILLRYLTLSLKVMLICVQAGRWQTVRGMPGDDVTMVTCHMWIDEAAHDAYDGSAIRWDSG